MDGMIQDSGFSILDTRYLLLDIWNLVPDVTTAFYASISPILSQILPVAAMLKSR